ncbi:hypothetical protein HYX13_00070 [Candidatus Woesearchaeota archaeon]|nr:hypothetical protein [Candidatus Woesearchaeota archaeon]
MNWKIKWEEEWAEVFALFFLVVGFIISVLLQSPSLTYLILFLAGGLAGRTYYFKESSQPILPFVLMILGFLLGYMLGNFWTNRVWGIIVFAFGFWGSLQLHRKEIIGTFKSKLFIK